VRLKGLTAPERDKPFPTWMIFSVIFAVLYTTHASLLRLPYYWDEAGYYIPAAWDFFRTGSLIPTSTLSNAHPPLPSVYLALWWKLSGFVPEVTREAVLLVASLGLLAVWRLAQRLTHSVAAAFWTVTLTAFYPVWFAQSTLAHADIFAAACTLWGLVYMLPEEERRPGVAVAWFMAAALAKETAIGVPLTLLLVALYRALRAKTGERSLWVAEAAWMALSVAPLACWYAWHYAKTGFVFGNPEFLRYNAESTLTPVRVLAALGHRILHLTAHMNMFVPVLLTLAAWMLEPRRERSGNVREGIAAWPFATIGVLLAANAVEFSVLGGALLTRYLLPMFPLVLVVAVTAFRRRVPYWQGLAAFSTAAFVAGLFINPPYGFAPEDNLQYARVVRMQMNGMAELAHRYPGATVLTAWPVSDALTKPELGYTPKRWDVTPIEDFSSAQIDRAAEEPEKYSAALVFSTKYEPQGPVLSLGARSRALDEEYFGLHKDLSPEEIALRLHGDLVWQQHRDGMWIALIRFNRQFEALAR
jgi:hypothetical protein